MSPKHIVAVNFTLCEDPTCSFRASRRTHLVVSKRSVALERGKATAISYTWGQFDRQIRTLGHFTDGVKVELELGAEWNVTHLALTLHELCNTPGSPALCWMDQLSGGRATVDVVRETLAKIPNVYRQLDVVILFPSARCTCLERRLESALSRQRSMDKGIDESKSIDEFALLRLLDRDPCPNDATWLYWTSRLWTRQKFLYALRVRIVWIGRDVVECPSWWQSKYTERPLGSTELMKLSPVIGHWFAKRLHGVKIKAEMITDLQFHLNRCARAARIMVQAAVREWTENALNSEMWSNDSASSAYARLLSGQSIQKHVPPFWQRLDLLQAVTFINKTLSDSMELWRQATKKQDYVLAVWVDCPGYYIPRGYDGMSMEQLFQNALQQLKWRWNLSIISPVPCGLFQNVDTSLLWEPWHYLSYSPISSTHSIYRPIALSRLVQISNRFDQVDANDLQIFPVRSDRRQPPEELSIARWRKSSLCLSDILIKSLPAANARHNSEFGQFLEDDIGRVIFEFISPDLESITQTSKAEEISRRITQEALLTASDDNHHGLLSSAKILSKVDKRSAIGFFKDMVGKELGLEAGVAEKAGLNVMLRLQTRYHPLLLGLTRYSQNELRDLRSFPARPHCCLDPQICEAGLGCELSNRVDSPLFEFSDHNSGGMTGQGRVVGTWVPAKGIECTTEESSRTDGRNPLEEVHLLKEFIASKSSIFGASKHQCIIQ